MPDPVSPASSPSGAAASAPIERESRHERVSRAAYLRFVARGAEPGHELEDWLAAETSIPVAV